MKPLLSTDDSCLSEPQQSLSFSDMFDPSSPSFLHQDPVRASTPVSSDGDVSTTHSNETSCSVLAPQNISLLSQDLTTSSCSLAIMQSPIKGDNPDAQQDQHCLLSSASFHNPYAMCDGYAYGSICYGYKLVGDNLDKTIKGICELIIYLNLCITSMCMLC